MKLVVKNNNGDKFTLQIRPNETFLDLKRRVELESGISLDLRDITSNKRNINESQRVIDYFLNEQNQQNVQIAQATDVVCAVPTCENKKSLNPDKTYFDFPQEDIRCHQWVLYCRRIAARLSIDSHRANLPINVGAPGTAICSDHFKWDQFVKNTTTLLKRTAVPSVNPELPPSTYPEPVRTFNVAKGKSMSMSATPQQANRLSTQVNLSKSTNLTSNNSLGASMVKLTCRLCALSMRNTVYIYSCEGKNKMLAEKINASLPIKVSMTDHLPKQVCRSCIDKLNCAFNLVEISCATDDAFRASSDKSANKGSMEDTHDPGSQCPCCLEGQLQVIQSARLTDEGNCQDENSQTTLPNIIFDNDETQQPEEIQDTIDSCQEDMLAGYLNDTLNEDQEVYICRLCGANVRSHTRATDHALSHGADGVFPCTMCELCYGNPQHLVDHFHVHYQNESELYCNKCDERFSTILELSEHRCGDENIKLEESALKKCVLCPRTFSSEQRWQFHVDYHTSSSKGLCSICGQTFPSEGKLYRHTLEHKSSTDVAKFDDTDMTDIIEDDSGANAGDNDIDSNKWSQATPDVDVQKPYRCEWCAKKFVRRSTLRNHIAAAHRHNRESSCFTCKVCREAFPTTTNAVIHMDSYHNNYVKNVPSYSFEMITVNRLYMCEYCEKLFAEMSVLHKHRESSHLSSSSTGVFFICKFCNNSFPSHSALQEHKAQHNKQDIPPEYQGEISAPTTYLCEYCERVFLNYVKYTEHLTIHFGSEPYVCRVCGTKYSTLDEVSEHRTVHGDIEPADDIDLNRPYDCHYCDKTFAIEDALTKHIRMHTGEKPFTCDVCGKGFSQSSGLNTHKKVHSNVRPFSCHLCPRTFKIKGDRDVHIRKHSGQRPFKCEFCFKAFMTQHVYSQHRKIHTGERPYRCDVCNVAFRRSHVLTVHKRIHTGEKPNVCDICGKRYRQKGDMLKHRRSQHGVGRNGAAQNVTTSLINQAPTIDAQELATISPQFFATLKPSNLSDD